MIEQFIERTFATRNAAHLEHWQTKSFSQHEALGDFYDKLLALTDKFVEARMGALGVVGKVPGQFEGGPVAALQDDVKWLATSRAELCSNVPALENIADEITGLYLQTLYKLERLK